MPDGRRAIGEGRTAEYRVKSYMYWPRGADFLTPWLRQSVAMAGQSIVIAAGMPGLYLAVGCRNFGRQQWNSKKRPTRRPAVQMLNRVSSKG